MFRKLLLIAIAALPGSTFAQYEVRLAPGGQHLFISLTPPAATSEPLKLAPRGVAWGLKSQVSDVRCGDDPLPEEADGSWLAPANCPRVNWRVIPDRVALDGADASQQRTLAVGPTPWILLAEPTSLLRPSGSEDAMTIRSAPGSKPLVGATQLAKGEFRVPRASSGPEFYVFGGAKLAKRTLGPFEITYVADHRARVQQLGLEALHADALSYLTRVLPVPQATAPVDRSLLVVWLGVSESRGEAGGAAGSRSFIANYLLSSPANRARNRALTMMILAHEQFHQLVDVLRSDLPPQPSAVWFNESLAHYYGLKALRAADKSKAAKDLWNKFIDPDRVIEHGLMELNRRYESGDQAVYNLFYSQGATFWHEIDTAIKASTRGEKSLDDYLAELHRSPMPSNAALPVSFTEELRRVTAGRVDRILLKYLTGTR